MDLLEYTVATLVLPALGGLAAWAALRTRETPLGVIGAGHVGNVLAAWVRKLVHAAPIRPLGLVDPFLWILGGALVALVVAAGVRRLWGRWRRSASPS